MTDQQPEPFTNMLTPSYHAGMDRGCVARDQPATMDPEPDPVDDQDDDDDERLPVAEACCDAEPEERPKLENLLRDYLQASEYTDDLEAEREVAQKRASAAREEFRRGAISRGIKPGMIVAGCGKAFQFYDSDGFVQFVPRKIVYAHRAD